MSFFEEALEALSGSGVMEALTSIGLRPTVPVEAADFADPAKRESWMRDKHMEVFPLQDPSDSRRHVDVFIREPFPFEELWARSVTMRYGRLDVHVASVEDVIEMKRVAGRKQDLADIEALELIEDQKRER